MIYPPPASEDLQQRQPVLGLAGFAAANPEYPKTLPNLEVSRDVDGECKLWEERDQASMQHPYGGRGAWQIMVQ
eukprot:9753138-Lingulodinium_polyedra.AAC.1